MKNDYSTDPIDHHHVQTLALAVSIVGVAAALMQALQSI